MEYYKMPIKEHKIRLGMAVKILQYGYTTKDENGQSMRLGKCDIGALVFKNEKQITAQFENSFVDLPLSELNRGYSVELCCGL